MLKRMIATVIILAAFWGAKTVYNAMGPQVEAAAAVNQAKDSIASYTYGQQMARGNLVSTGMNILLAIALAAIWGSFLYKKLRPSNNASALALLAVAISFSLAGCGPSKVLPLENIGPNETAYVIPLEGDSANQGKIQSVKYLEDHKVLAKRIEIPVRERDLGHGLGNYEWLPTVKVIKVDRTPITREWTKGRESGTSNSNQAIAVESLESINFRVGINTTGNVLEEDASTFLYWFAGKPISSVMDENVRGFVQSLMSAEFGKLTLEDCKKQKGRIIAQSAEAATAHFKKMGLNIMNMGGSEGLLYDDPAIQDAINKTATSEMYIEIARKEKLAQDERNKMVVAKSTADRQAAEQFSQAQAAQVAKLELDIKRIQAEATLEAAKRWKGDMPGGIIPQGSNILFGLDRPLSNK